jgi:hypothetical protein
LSELSGELGAILKKEEGKNGAPAGEVRAPAAEIKVVHARRETHDGGHAGE